MAAKPERHLRIVDERGQVHDLEDCPNCAEYNRELARMRTILANLRRDKAKEAREHKLWPRAVTLFHEWKIATGPNRPSGENKSRWSADRFWLCQPYLDADGFVVCRWAVYGVAYEPNRKTLPSGVVESYDDWELCFRNRATFERYARRGWANPEARKQFPEAVRFTGKT